MTTWIVLGVCAAVVVGYVAVGPGKQDGYKNALKAARTSGDITQLVEVLSQEEDPDGTKWDQAISALWQAYARDAAMTLIVAAAQHSGAKIIHYWIQQAMSIEPEIAAEHFTPQFLTKYFDPSEASQCGRCGCGG